MRSLPIFCCLVVLAACGKDKKAAPPRDDSNDQVAPTAQSDANLLGHEIFDLIDRALSFRSSHRNRLPRSLRELGIDELTRETARQYVVKDKIPQVTVSFRGEGHVLHGCTGTSAVLEEVSLSGEFTVTCTVPSGGITVLKVAR